MINRNPLICVHKPVSASFVGVVAVTILSSLVYLKQPTPSPGIVKPLFGQGIYADDPGDAWNRIFHCLFSRTVKTHLSSDFPGGAPFDRIRSVGLVRGLSISKRLSEREEIGDRAIEP